MTREDTARWCADLELAGWRRDGWSGGAAIFRGRGGLLVLLELEPHGGKAWVHVSVSIKTPDGGNSLPSWAELAEVKRVFIGEQRKAIQVLPAAEEHFTFADVLHLWHCLGRDPLPDFRRFDPGLGVMGL